MAPLSLQMGLPRLLHADRYGILAPVGKILVTGSVAFDTIMVFQGKFGDHILPEKTHQISVSFLVDDLTRRPGGTASNVAYTLALLGEQPLVAAGIGNDFGATRGLLEGIGVDFSASLFCDDVPCAAAYITTDLDNNQITPFHPGAMARAGQIDLTTIEDVDYLIVSADDPAAMARHIDAASALKTRLVFSPGQGLPALSDDVLRRGVDSSWMLIANDYEMNLITSRLGTDAASIGKDRLVIATLGGDGCDLYGPDFTGPIHVAAAPIEQEVDPTGAGDAFIAGFVHAIRSGSTPSEAARIASVTAAYVVEQSGPQEHHYTRDHLFSRLGATPVG